MQSSSTQANSLEQIIEAMDMRGVDATELSESLGIAASNVRKMLRNETNLTARRLDEIAAALNCRWEVTLRVRR